MTEIAKFNGHVYTQMFDDNSQIKSVRAKRLRSKDARIRPGKEQFIFEVSVLVNKKVSPIEWTKIIQ